MEHDVVGMDTRTLDQERQDLVTEGSGYPKLQLLCPCNPEGILEPLPLVLQQLPAGDAGELRRRPHDLHDAWYQRSADAVLAAQATLMCTR